MLKEHDYSIDIARGIACFLVIVGHVPTTPAFLHTWVYSFHMPLFFIISGVVINTDYTFKQFVIKRIKGLLIPYYLLNILVWFIESFARVGAGIVFNSEIDTRRIIDNFIGIIIGYRLTNYYYAMWFVIVLFIALIASYLIIKATNNSKLMMGVIGVLLILIQPFIWRYVKGLPFSLDLLPISTGYVLLGNSLFKHFLHTNYKGRTIIAFVFLILCAFISVRASVSYGDVDLYSCHTGGIVFLLITSLLGSYGTLVLSDIIKRSNVLEFFSASSLTFYAFQNKLVIPLCDRTSSLITRSAVGLHMFEWIITVALTTLALSAISIAIDKYAPWIAGKKRKTII